MLILVRATSKGTSANRRTADCASWASHMRSVAAQSSKAWSWLSYIGLQLAYMVISPALGACPEGAT